MKGRFIELRAALHLKEGGAYVYAKLMHSESCFYYGGDGYLLPDTDLCL